MRTAINKKRKSRRAIKVSAHDATPVAKQTNETGDAGAVPRVLAGELWPRSFDYPTGFNTELSPRATQSVSFRMMRNLAENCDLVRIALQMRKDQIRGLRWDVTVKPGGDAKTLEPRRVKIRDFFIRPDPLNDMLFHEWIAAWLEDLLVLDAACLYMLRDRAGRLIGLPEVDGSSIKPVLNASGYCPPFPYTAYVQVIKGQTTCELNRNQLLYSTYNPRPDSAYGRSPVEMVITTAHLALKRQLSAITYQTDGSIPDYLIGAPPGWTPDQIRAVEQSLNDYLSGNWAKRHKFKLVPAGMEPHAMKQPDFTTQVDEWLARIIGAAFGVAPHLLLRQRTKQQADVLESQQTDIGLDPLRRFISGLLTERIIRDQFGESQLQFTWTSDKEENETLAVSKAKAYIPLGVLGGDEIREDAGRLPLGMPPYIQMPNGILFLTPKVIHGIASGEIEMINQDGGFRVTEPPSGGQPPSGVAPSGTPSNSAVDGKLASADSANQILIENELAQWRRTALADLKRGKPFRDFACHYLPAATIENVRTGLSGCCDEAAIKELFAGLQPA